MELWERESCIAWGWRCSGAWRSSLLGKRRGQVKGFVLTSMISFCRRADVLQPRPIASLEPLPVALETHLSIFRGAQQDGEEQGHAEHCDLHLPLRCGKSWVKLEKVRGSFIPPRTPPCPSLPQEPPGQSQAWRRHQPWQQAQPRHRVICPASSTDPATFPGITPASCMGQLHG